MKNSKGFTLVELLAAVVILGIMTAFSVPSIMKVITKNRDRTYIQDAKKMVTLAESRIRSGNVAKPAVDNCMIITMRGLQSGEFKKAPNGGEYNKDESFVFVKRTSNNTENMPQYEYYVYLVEKYGDNRYRGINLQKISNDANINKTSSDGSDIDIENFSKAYVFDDELKNISDLKGKVNAFFSDSTLCVNEISKY